VEAKNGGGIKARDREERADPRLNGNGMIALTASTGLIKHFMFCALQPLMGGGEIEEFFWGKLAAVLKSRPVESK